MSQGEFICRGLFQTPHVYLYDSMIACVFIYPSTTCVGRGGVLRCSPHLVKSVALQSKNNLLLLATVLGTALLGVQVVVPEEDNVSIARLGQSGGHAAGHIPVGSPVHGVIEEDERRSPEEDLLAEPAPHVEHGGVGGAS